MAGINFVRRWVMSQMTKKADDGIMITLPDSSKVDLNVNITMDRLLRNGIDPDAFTNPEQVNNAINMLNTRMVSRTIPADSAEGREITQKIFGKQKAPVFDLEGNRIPEGSGIMGGKAIKDLMDSGQVSKGARGMKKSKKVEDREMFEGANKRLKTEAQLKAEMEASNKKGIAGIKNKRQLTEDEYQDFLDEVGGADQLEAYNFDGTVGDAKRIVKEQKDYMSQMEMEFRKGKLDPEPGSRTPQRKRFLQKKLEEAESSGDARLLSREEREELFDLDDIPEYAKGGRAGFAGGSDMGTVADSKGKTGPSKGGYQGGGTGPVERPSGGGGNNNDTNYDYTIPKQIVKQTAINTAKNLGRRELMNTLGLAKFSNPIGIAMALKGLYDQTKNPTLTEEEAMGGGITGMATGGRAGFMAGGMGRRAFLKLMGGTGAAIGAAKSGIFSGLGKGAGKEVAKEVVKQSASTPPPYFFKLAEKIKMLGDDATATTDRTIAKTLKSKDGKSTYLLEEDVTSGDTIIKKINKEGDEMITDVEIMELRKGEVVKGKDGKAMKTPDEYEEVTEANARIEGDAFNDPYYSDGIEIDDILREVDDIPVPKASGGIARMLGE